MNRRAVQRCWEELDRTVGRQAANRYKLPLDPAERKRVLEEMAASAVTSEKLAASAVTVETMAAQYAESQGVTDPDELPFDPDAAAAPEVLE